MSENANTKLNKLTALVRQLMRKKESQFDEEDPSVNPRIPVTELSIYKKLSGAFPSIKDSMSYVPQPLNDSASTAVKKLDTKLHAIQNTLSQTTRPIDYYVHRKIQKNLGIIVAEDPDSSFSNAVWALLSKIATTVVQNRLGNLHKGM
ncbi:hypothetical protein AYI68_g7326 [Smittium mucronatum]|uniref:Uncharacterized protein n=1 Tax=Smittium mucronatum TaxID=133383 RepID=A0A1R0GP19_9FUNG|nr:hypothetical protein AYI68_g7326 [Smittium mucronatum]